MPKFAQWCAGVAIGLLACSSSNPENDGGNPEGGGDGGMLGSGMVGTITPAAMGGDISSPFDATPDPSGTMVYFTAISITNGPGVFSAPAAGGNVTQLAAGDPIVSPFGIAITPDGKTLYVADSGSPASADNDSGRVFVISTAGGMPTALAGPDGYKPKSIAINGPDLYFTGVSPMDGSPGVFRVPLAGGSVSVVGTGAFADPSGISVTAAGVVYVLDTIASSNNGAIFKCENMQCISWFSGLAVGYPAGLAIVQDESAILVSALDPKTHTDLVWRIELATKNAATFNKGIDMFDEPAGLHRAPNTDVYAWADSKANGNGTVFVLSK